jgi:hypothetical protein
MLKSERDYLIKLLYENETLRLVDFENDIVYWEANEDIVNECKRSTNLVLVDSDKYCHNYVRVIAQPQEDSSTRSLSVVDRILVCGTYANRPLCTWRSRSAPNNVIDSFDGAGKVPPSPDASLAYSKLGNGDFYFGTSIDYSEQGMKADFLIERSIGPSLQLRTDQYNSNWLNGI